MAAESGLGGRQGDGEDDNFQHGWEADKNSDLPQTQGLRSDRPTVIVEHWELAGKPGGGRFAVYALLVRERGVQWRIKRRWNDLKEMMGALQVSSPAFARASGRIPKFEAHSWRFGGAALDPEFLDSRKESMQALLDAIIKELEVSVLRGTGPLPVLRLLDEVRSQCQQPIFCIEHGEQ
eukprot:6179939-Pleurochrysis_carterae.AAC.2